MAKDIVKGTPWPKVKWSWAGILVIAFFVSFPYLTAWLTGNPVGKGAPLFWMHLLSQVFIYAIYAISYDLLLGYTGILSFGHAAFFGTGAYVTGILLKHLGLSLPVVFPIALVVAFLQGLLVGAISLRVKGVYFAMVTLAFAELFYILAEASDFRRWTGAEDGLQGIPVPPIISPVEHRIRYLLPRFCGNRSALPHHQTLYRIAHRPCAGRYQGERTPGDDDGV